MFCQQNKIFCTNISLVFIALLMEAHGHCLGVRHTTICLNNLDEETAQEALKHVLTMYKEAEMPLAGEPVSVRAKTIRSGGNEEVHIVFLYVDNTPNDVIQNCGIVINRNGSECESIRTFCSAFLSRTPRPLLRRKQLIVCDNGAGAPTIQVVDDWAEENTEAVTPPPDEVTIMQQRDTSEGPTI